MSGSVIGLKSHDPIPNLHWGSNTNSKEPNVSVGKPKHAQKMCTLVKLSEKLDVLQIVGKGRGVESAQKITCSSLFYLSSSSL